jgi:hypothetical protein
VGAALLEEEVEDEHFCSLRRARSSSFGWRRIEPAGMFKIIKL